MTSSPPAASGRYLLTYLQGARRARRQNGATPITDRSRVNVLAVKQLRMITSPFKGIDPLYAIEFSFITE